MDIKLWADTIDTNENKVKVRGRPFLPFRSKTYFSSSRHLFNSICLVCDISLCSFFCLLVLLLSSETPRSSFKIRTCVQVRAHTRSFQLSVFPVFVISSQCIPRAKLQWSGTCNTASNCRHVKRMLDKNRWEHHNFSEFVFLSETETCISQFTQYRCFEIKRLMNGTSELRSHRHCVKVVVKRPENLQTKRELWSRKTQPCPQVSLYISRWTDSLRAGFHKVRHCATWTAFSFRAEM